MVEGADFSERHPAVAPTSAQFYAALLQAEPKFRYRVLDSLLADAELGRYCEMFRHKDQLDHAQRLIRLMQSEIEALPRSQGVDDEPATIHDALASERLVSSRRRETE